jgi:hypothetical protein
VVNFQACHQRDGRAAATFISLYGVSSRSIFVPVITESVKSRSSAVEFEVPLFFRGLYVVNRSITQPTPVSSRVTSGTERNQILRGIIAQLASRSQVVDLQVSWRSATLAPPAVSSQYLVPKLLIDFGTKLKSKLLRAQRIHTASLSGNLGVILLKICSSEKVRTDHLQAIASRLVCSQHQAGSFDGLLDHRQLTLVKLEVDDLPRFCFLPCQMSLDLPLELFLG